MSSVTSPGSDSAGRVARPAERASGRWQDALVPGGITAALAIYVVATLHIGDFQNDDSTSVFIAHLDASRFWTALSTSEANGSLFYLLLRFWKGFGTDEVTLRLLPAAFAIATVPLLYSLTRRLFDVRYAVITSAVLATNLLFLTYTRTVRSYSLAMFLATLASYLFVRNLDRGTTRGWLAYAVVSALGTYAHFFMGLVVVSHVLTLLRFRERVDWLRVASAGLLLAVLVSPIAAFILFQDVGQVDWIPEPTWDLVGFNLYQLLGAGSALGVGAVAILAALGAIRSIVRLPDGESAQAHLLALTWCVIPIGGAIVISFIKPLFLARYLLVALPPLAMLVAIGALSMGRLWRPIAVAAIVAVAATSVVQHREDPGGAYWDEKAALVLDRAGPRDALVFYAPTELRPFGYYAGYFDDSATDTGPPSIYPSRLWLGFSRSRFNPDFERLAESVRNYDRIWFVTGANHDPARRQETQAMLDMLFQTCGRPADRHFTATVRLFTGCST